MWREILSINPRLDNKDLSKMEKSLSKRFGGIAKKFGKGLVGALAGGGIVGAALGIVERIVNPIKDVQEAIDKTLKTADDIVTNAKQFDTTVGKLTKLIAIAKSTGLEEDNLYMLINKFQNAVAEAAADPNKETSVRKFVGQKDTVDAFFGFIQSLQKLGEKDKGAQLRVQQEVFGEKQTLKMADFLQTDFAKQMVKIRALPASNYDRVEKLGALNDRTDELGAARFLEDMLKKSQIINESMINARDRQLKMELEQENYRIGTYKELMALNMLTTKSLQLIERSLSEMIKTANAADGLYKLAEKFSVSRALRFLHGKGDY